MYWPLTGAFMNVSAVTLRLLLIITAYMDDLLHEDTNIFFLSITRIIFLSRIIELSNFNHTEYRGRSRIFFFFSCPELSNFRIFVFTRNIANSHGFLLHTEYHGKSRVSSSHGVSQTVTDFLFSSCHELSRLVLGPTDRREVIFELSNFCLP